MQFLFKYDLCNQLVTSRSQVLEHICNQFVIVIVIQVLEHMEMTSAFTDVLHVANLTTGSHLMSILTQSDAFSKVSYGCCANFAKKTYYYILFTLEI